KTRLARRKTVCQPVAIRRRFCSVAECGVVDVPSLSEQHSKETKKQDNRKNVTHKENSYNECESSMAGTRVAAEIKANCERLAGGILLPCYYTRGRVATRAGVAGPKTQGTRTRRGRISAGLFRG